MDRAGLCPDQADHLASSAPVPVLTWADQIFLRACWAVRLRDSCGEQPVVDSHTPTQDRNMARSLLCYLSMAVAPPRSGSAASVHHALAPPRASTAAAAAAAASPRPYTLHHHRGGGRRNADLRCRRRLLTARGERPADPEPEEDEYEEARSAGFDAAVALFNSGEYHACHDVVEELWYGAEGPARTLLHGILQCAVGFHHLFNQVLPIRFPLHCTPTIACQISCATVGA